MKELIRNSYPIYKIEKINKDEFIFGFHRMLKDGEWVE